MVTSDVMTGYIWRCFMFSELQQITKYLTTVHNLVIVSFLAILLYTAWFIYKHVRDQKKLNAKSAVGRLLCGLWPEKKNCRIESQEYQSKCKSTDECQGVLSIPLGPQTPDAGCQGCDDKGCNGGVGPTPCLVLHEQSTSRN